MAGLKTGGVVDWQWLMREMPIASDAYSKRTRRILFGRMDAAGNGLLHISEVVRGFEKTIRVVRGMMDIKPVWATCFRLARASVDPVIPLGLDFMEQNQFRMYLVCIWMYFRLWEYFYRTYREAASVIVTARDLPAVVEILEDFGYPDAERFDAFARPSLLDGRSEFNFSKFAELVLEHVLPELSESDADFEQSNAAEQIASVNPALLRKDALVGGYKAHSLDTLQPRMTGFVYKKNLRKARSDPSLLKAAPQENAASPQWTSQYAMQFTTTKFLPKARNDPYNHPCRTERDLPHSHPYFQVLKPSLSPSSSCSHGGPRLQSDVGRLLPTGPRPEASAPLKAAGFTMAQRLQRLGVIQSRSEA